MRSLTDQEIKRRETREKQWRLQKQKDLLALARKVPTMDPYDAMNLSLRLFLQRRQFEGEPASRECLKLFISIVETICQAKELTPETRQSLSIFTIQEFERERRSETMQDVERLQKELDEIASREETQAQN